MRLLVFGIWFLIIFTLLLLTGGLLPALIFIGTLVGAIFGILIFGVDEE